VRRGGIPSATLRQRVEAALACGRALADVIYVPTGAIGRFPPAEATVMAELLIQGGVRSDRIWREETGTDTLSSVRACTRLLRDRGFTGPVLACSSDYHLPRCRILLHLAGWPTRSCSAPATQRSRWYWRLRETAALPYDTALALTLRTLGRL
jgi:uncharacterized SAM-binding protein YcdF (DUF218 family)